MATTTTRRRKEKKRVPGLLEEPAERDETSRPKLLKGPLARGRSPSQGCLRTAG